MCLIWKTQLRILLHGYISLGYINGSYPFPPYEIVQDGNTIYKMVNNLWMKQDSLLQNMIMTINVTIAPMFVTAATS